MKQERERLKIHCKWKEIRLNRSQDMFNTLVLENHFHFVIIVCDQYETICIIFIKNNFYPILYLSTTNSLRQ